MKGVVKVNEEKSTVAILYYLIFNLELVRTRGIRLFN